MALTMTPLDRWTLGYAGVATVALISRWSLPLPHPGLLALAHVLLFALVFLAAALRRRKPDAFLAEFYPVIVVTALYTEVGILNLTRGISHDGLVQSWERMVFGGQPSLDWIRGQPWPPMSAVLHLAYMSYYIIVPGAPLGLWLSGRREAGRETLLRIMATFYVCYTIFLLLPVAGPRYLFPMAENAATRVAPARWVHTLLQSGSAWGTAFPSSHVAVSLVAALSATLAWPALGVPLLGLTLLLSLGTVYGQFHYAVDAVAGVVVGVAMLAVRQRRAGNSRRKGQGAPERGHAPFAS